LPGAQLTCHMFREWQSNRERLAPDLCGVERLGHAQRGGVSDGRFHHGQVCLHDGGGGDIYHFDSGLVGFLFGAGRDARGQDAQQQQNKDFFHDRFRAEEEGEESLGSMPRSKISVSSSL